MLMSETILPEVLTGAAVTIGRKSNRKSCELVKLLRPSVAYCRGAEQVNGDAIFAMRQLLSRVARPVTVNGASLHVGWQELSGGREWGATLAEARLTADRIGELP